jgi:protein-disulfide isomerase
MMAPCRSNRRQKPDVEIMRPERGANVPARSRVARLVVVLLSVGVVSAIVASFPRQTATSASGQAPLSADQRADFLRWWESQPRVDVPVSAEGAAVLIVKFSDFQCPMCAQSYFSDGPVLKKYEAQSAGAVKFVQKDYPLAPGCNPNVQYAAHDAPCEAAAAARMARARGRGDEMEQWLYTNQKSVTGSVVREMAQKIGHVADFDREYKQALEGVKADVALGTRLGVRMTPTFFINGVKLEGGLMPQYLDLAIGWELQRRSR